jgi:predicted ester cyclase
MATISSTLPTPAEIGSLVARAVDAFNDPARREEYLDTHDSDVIAYGMVPEPVGFDGVRAVYESIWAGMPDATIHIDDFLIDMDRIALRFAITGTQTGPLFGVPATGRTIRLEGQTIAMVRSGKIVERRTTTDMLGVLVQLGALPPPRA